MSGSSAKLPPGFVLRPPWPDELPRLREFFPGPRPKSAVLVRLLLHETPERIVGACMISLPASIGAAGRLGLRLRPAYRGTPLADAFFSAACALAGENGITRIAATVAAGSPELEFYLAQGARVLATDRFYEGEIAPVLERLRATRVRETDVGRFAIGPLADGDFATVAAMAAAHGLLNPARAEAALRNDYEMGTCFVAREESRVVGAVLTKARPRGQIYIEILMVDPASIASSGPITRLLLTASCAGWQEEGFTTFSLSCQPEKDRHTVNLARRMGCRLVREEKVLSWAPLAGLRGAE